MQDFEKLDVFHCDNILQCADGKKQSDREKDKRQNSCQQSSQWFLIPRQLRVPLPPAINQKTLPRSPPQPKNQGPNASDH